MEESLFKMRILIFGAKGQLGREFCHYFNNIKVNYKAYNISNCNISNYRQIESAIIDFMPNIIINCSAYNLVDVAETNTYEAYYTNAIGPTHLAILCNKYNCKLVHYSTDYVFDGSKEDFYDEKDTPNPLNIYGFSKLLGENQVKLISDDYLIFRLSWVYGEGSPNTFLSKLKQWSLNTRSLKIVDDEISIPTSVRTIVKITMESIKHNLTGLYHLTNSGKASRWEWATLLNNIANLNLEISRAKSADFNLPAKRPLFSAMSNQNISDILKINIADWQIELVDYYKSL